MKRAILFVAHTDDCIIFANSFLQRNIYNYKWSIVYCFSNPLSERGLELIHYWRNFNIECQFLNFFDNPFDFTSGICSISDDLIIDKIKNKFNSNFDLLLTHGSIGEYGHPHHIVCHNVSFNFDADKRVFFAPVGFFNIAINTYPVFFNILPVHLNAINFFKSDFLSTPQRYFSDSIN